MINAYVRYPYGGENKDMVHGICRTLEKKKIRANNEEQYNRFVAAKTETIHAARDAQIRAIDAAFDKVDAALDAASRANSDRWVAQIVANVTNA